MWFAISAISIVGIVGTYCIIDRILTYNERKQKNSIDALKVQAEIREKSDLDFEED